MLRGHPGPFGKRCGWKLRRVYLAVDVRVPEDMPLDALQRHISACLLLALELGGARGSQVGCAIGCETSCFEPRRVV